MEELTCVIHSSHDVFEGSALMNQPQPVTGFI